MSTPDPVELLREIVAFSRVSRTAAGGHPLWSRVFAAIDSPVEDVDSMVDKLDARCAETGERWEVYRAAIGGWIATAADPSVGPSALDPARLSIHHETLSGALAGLLATPRLPVVPRQPAAVAGALKVVKDGSTWDVFEDGQRIAWKRTKREANEYVDQYRDAVRARYEDWASRWATIVNSGVEGVDFYWKK